MQGGCSEAKPIIGGFHPPLLFPIYLIVGADIEQDDFIFYDVKCKGYAIAVSKAYCMTAGKFSAKRMYFQVWLKWVTLQI